MTSSNYKLLGRLPIETVNYFHDEIMKIKESDSDDVSEGENGLKWIWLNYKLNFEFLKIFQNDELNIQFIPQGYKSAAHKKNYFNQKAFYTPADSGFMIHKDGWEDNAAMNIALSCNDGDWVRWYDEETVNRIGKVSLNHGINKSRNVTNIKDWETTEFIEEVRTQVGDVYVLNTNVYHSYKCSGPKDRVIIQTKFVGNPLFESLSESLSKSSFKNLIQV